MFSPSEFSHDDIRNAFPSLSSLGSGVWGEDIDLYGDTLNEAIAEAANLHNLEFNLRAIEELKQLLSFTDEEIDRITQTWILLGIDVTGDDSEADFPGRYPTYRSFWTAVSRIFEKDKKVAAHKKELGESKIFFIITECLYSIVIFISFMLLFLSVNDKFYVSNKSFICLEKYVYHNIVYDFHILSVISSVFLMIFLCFPIILSKIFSFHEENTKIKKKQTIQGLSLFMCVWTMIDITFWLDWEKSYPSPRPTFLHFSSLSAIQCIPLVVSAAIWPFLPEIRAWCERQFRRWRQ